MEYTDLKKNHEYGCMMIYYDAPGWEKVLGMINDNDLYVEKNNDHFGKVYEPHVTLLYGLHSNKINDEELFSYLLDKTPPKMSMSSITLFDNNPSYDVVKFDVEGKELHDMNKTLRDNFPYTIDFPDYNPHSTIGYVQSGKGKQYIKNLTKPFTIKPSKLVYSKPDGSKIIKKFNVK